MSTKKITQLQTATDITASDFIQVVDIEDGGMAPSGTNKKISAQTLGNYLPVISTGSTTSRSLKDRFADTVNVKDFGAKGDGITDDTAAILGAIATGKTVLFNSGETYFHSPISHSGNVYFSTTGEGKAKLLCSNTNTSSSVFSFSGTEKTATTLTADAAANTTEITVASVSNISVGDLLKITGTNLWPNDNRGTLYFGQLAKVVSINGLVVTIESSIVNGLPSGSSVTPITPINVGIENIQFERPLTTGSTRGFAVFYSDNSFIKNCEFNNLSRISLQVGESYKIEICNNKIVGAKLAISEGVGYGIGIGGCYSAYVCNNEMYDCRRGIDIGGGSIPSIHCYVGKNKVFGGGIADDLSSEFWPAGGVLNYGIGSHGGADSTIYSENVLFNLYSAIICRGRNELIVGNQILGAVTYPVNLLYSSAITVKDNEYLDQFQYGLDTVSGIGGVVDSNSILKRASDFVYINVNTYDISSGVTIDGNIVKNVTKGLVFIDGDAGKVFNNTVIRDNLVYAQSTSGSNVSLVRSSSLKYIPNFIEYGNIVKRPADNNYLKFISVSVGHTSNTVHQNGHNSYYATVNDQTAISIFNGNQTSQKIVRMILISNNASPRFNGMLRNNSTTTIDFGGTSGITVLDSALNGTTGSDGTWSISHANHGIYVENRSGGNAFILVEIIG